MSNESTNPKDAIGRTKPPLHLIPPGALIQEAVVMGLGADKYGPYNWRGHSVAASVYIAAALRHIHQWHDGTSLDPESNASHLAHARASLGILLDAEATGSLIDDRPPAGAASEQMAYFTQGRQDTPRTRPENGCDNCPQTQFVTPGGIFASEEDIRNIGQVFSQYKGYDLISVGGLPTVVFLASSVDEPGDVEYTSPVGEQPTTSSLPPVTDVQREEVRRRFRSDYATYYVQTLGCHANVATHIAGGTSFPQDFLDTAARLGHIPATKDNTPRTVYIAGPMRGYDEYNYPAFHAARNRFLAAGYAVVSPADIDTAADGGAEHEYDHSQWSYVYRDLMTLMGFGSEDAIAMLPGWESSTGAVAEFMVARWLGLHILDAQTGFPLDIVYTPALNRSVANYLSKMQGSTPA